MKSQIANILTSSRILSAVCLLFCPAFSITFYILYIFCGITDMVDGTIARKTNSASLFGAKFDTASDFVFAAVCFAKILPTIHLPVWLWIWITLIAILKIGIILWVLICGNQAITLHSFLNKTTGFLLFLFPLTLTISEPIYSSAVICSVAMLTVIKEGYLIITICKQSET